MKTLFYLLIFSFLLTSCGEQSDEIYPASAEEIAAVKNAALNKCLTDRKDFNSMINSTKSSFTILNPGDEYNLTVSSTDDGKSKTEIVNAKITVLNKSNDNDTVYIYVNYSKYSTYQSTTPPPRRIFKFTTADNENYFNAYQYLACTSGAKITTTNLFTVSSIINNVSEKSTYSHYFLQNFPGLISAFANYYTIKTNGTTSNKWEITISPKTTTPSFNLANYLVNTVTDDYCLFEKYGSNSPSEETILGDFKNVEETLFNCQTAGNAEFSEVGTPP